MSRYIDAELLEPDTEWDDYDDRYVSYSQLEIDSAPTADVRENVRSEWVLTDHAYTVHCKRCRYKNNRASQYCPECGAYMTNGTKWFGADDER